MPVERHRLYIAQGTEWVALSDVGSLVGFLAAEVFEAELHIWQLAVRLDDQGRGVGGRLLEAADSFARARNLRSITLTTFADVPWNAPWYSRHGFTVATDDERLAGLTRMESSRGYTAELAGSPVRWKSCSVTCSLLWHGCWAFRGTIALPLAGCWVNGW